MEILKEFIISFIEGICMLILWRKLGLRDYLLKNTLIIAIGALIMSLINFNIYFEVILSQLIILLLISYVHKKNIIKTCIEFLIVLSLNIILQLIGVGIFKFLIGSYNNTYCYNLIIQLSIFMFTYIMCNVVFKNKIYYIENIDKKAVGFFVINLLSYILILKIIWNFNENIILKNMVKIIFLISSIFIFNILMYSYVTKIEKQKNNAKAQEQYNNILKSLTEEIRQRQHDFRNHLNIINGLAQVSDEREVKDKIKAYIGKLSNSMMDIEKIIYIDNTIIRAIIYSKFQEAKKKNIGFSYCITSSLDNMPLEDFQMSEILSNLIDNAFEAVASQEDQLIEVEIYEEEDNSIIEVRNSGITVQPENVEKIFERGFSTKGGKGRGYGLYNVKRIVEGTGGNAQIYLEDNYTVFKLIIKNKKA